MRDVIWILDTRREQILAGRPINARGRNRVGNHRTLRGIVHVLKDRGCWVEYGDWNRIFFAAIFHRISRYYGKNITNFMFTVAIVGVVTCHA